VRHRRIGFRTHKGFPYSRPPKLPQLTMNIGSPTQGTDFTLAVFGRYTCNTFAEAIVTHDANARSAAGLAQCGEPR